ncbi:MAG: response regulator transcription factor [Sphaerochaeta sp.]|jgi:NarL family two-component system response regulator LiaR|nr:response regulator transcription factor [Sphaerochaetaceae bacterium]MEA4863840.1 response regulator transcription factor [Sphaerochaeta sp.]
MSIRILLVDDDSLVMESLEILFSTDTKIVIVGTATSGAQAIQFVHEHQVDMVLMDIQMPEMDGLTATKIIHDSFPQVKIIMLTTFHDYQNIHRSLQAGASGYILKSDDTQKQIMTIKSVYAGLPVISEKALLSYSEPLQQSGLSHRENEILYHVANGLSNKEIAEQLFITEGTVRNAISIILEKVQVRDRTQLAIYYWQQKGSK